MCTLIDAHILNNLAGSSLVVYTTVNLFYFLKSYLFFSFRKRLICGKFFLFLLHVHVSWLFFDSKVLTPLRRWNVMLYSYTFKINFFKICIVSWNHSSFFISQEVWYSGNVSLYMYRECISTGKFKLYLRDRTNCCISFKFSNSTYIFYIMI